MRAAARFLTPPAKPCMPLSRHTALPLSVILSPDHVMFKAKRSEILGLVGIRLPAKDTLGTHASRQIRLNRSSNLFSLEAETLLHFTDVHRYVPLRVRSATSALAFPTDCRPWLPEVVPGSSLLWRHRLPSKASMAHSHNHPSMGLQRSCLLTPMVWFRRRVPIDPIRSLRNPDHPGGNPGQSPAPAHRACFVWPATQFGPPWSPSPSPVALQASRYDRSGDRYVELEG